jgi:hypothetical protein
MREGRVTLSARDASLREILTEFGRASGIEVHLERGLSADESTTIAFERMAAEEGLRRLLRARNFVLVYSGTALAEVRAYRDGKDEAPPRASGAGTASIAPRPRREGRAPWRSSRVGGEPATEAAETAGSGAERTAAADEAARLEAFRLRAKALGDPDPDERAAGLAELAVGDDEQLALRTASNVLEVERVPDVIERALSVFAGVETAPIEPILSFLGANRVRDTAVRVQALELLTERGKSDPRVRELLVALAGGDGDREVRQSARSLLEDLTTD